MASLTTLKSILKKSPYPSTSSSKADRDRELALYHANLIQERKDIELTILLNTETLIDYPLASAPYDESNPSTADAENFKNLIRPFQPSDYDALILERNINEHCGFSLCSNARVRDGGAGKYRLVGKYGKAKDFKVVEKEELEKWCSEACAKRALYVRVQLSETPAWERDAGYGTEIELLDEPKPEEDQVLEGVGKLSLAEHQAQDKKQNAVDLALERGDKGLAAKRGLVDVIIKEKDIQGGAQAPSFEIDDLGGKLDTLHMALEGHTARFGSERQKQPRKELQGGEGEDDEATDWKM
jgi:hypothetical protein